MQCLSTHQASAEGYKIFDLAKLHPYAVHKDKLKTQISNRRARKISKKSSRNKNLVFPFKMNDNFFGLGCKVLEYSKYFST